MPPCEPSHHGTVPTSRRHANFHKHVTQRQRPMSIDRGSPVSGEIGFRVVIHGLADEGEVRHCFFSHLALLERVDGQKGVGVHAPLFFVLEAIR